MNSGNPFSRFDIPVVSTYLHGNPLTQNDGKIIPSSKTQKFKKLL